MFNSKQLTVLLGGLGAIVVLAAGAQFAVGGQPDKTRDTRSALHGGKAKNVIFFLGDGMGDAGDHRRPLLPVRRGRPA